MSWFSSNIQLPNQEKGRLDNLSITSASYGKNISIIYGLKRITTTLLMAEDVKQLVHTEVISSGGKGGSSTTYEETQFSYTGRFASLLSANKIQGVVRIWMNGKLFYENRPYMGGDVLEASNRAKELFTLYTGTQTQISDPKFGSSNGFPNNPAYRGRAYIVFSPLALEPFGNKIPVLEVEVAQYGTGSNDDIIQPYKIPLRNIVGDICIRSGLTSDQFDVSELDTLITGYEIKSSGRASEFIEELAGLYQFYPFDDGEKLVFTKQPTPILAPQYLKRCVINEDSLMTNALHNVLGQSTEL